MAVLEHLEPRCVFHFFEELSAIPHGSGNTKAISDYLVDFAVKRELEVYQDHLNNVIIIKEATPGYETVDPIILQGHMDMVCEKAPDCEKDMAAEGLDLVVDGDTIYARGTTLGGDDGIAVAMMLAVLNDRALLHPRVEAVFTVDEEIGMLGATGIDVSMLKGRRMLNLDSEEEGVFTVSCAGGCDAQCTLPLTCVPYAGVEMAITVGGLQGGHSGVEIHKGRGNANILLGRVLYAAAKKAELRLVCIDGGLKDNAIPRESKAVLVTVDPEAVMAVCREMEAIYKNEYRLTDSAIFVTVEKSSCQRLPMDEACTWKVIRFLTCVPDGVQVMSSDIPGLVQTSLNLGILQTTEKALQAHSCVRSSVTSQKHMLTDRLTCLLEALGGEVEIRGDYAGWAYRQDSPLRDLLTEVYVQQYGHAPKVEAIHAGVECGIFAGKLPELDCVSLGPNLTEIHTCRERMDIGSVQRLWQLLQETLRRMR